MRIPPRKSTHAYERHPLSALWPDLDLKAHEALRQNMRRRGYDPLEPVVLYEDRVLDGWHRLLVARELGLDVPTIDYAGDDLAAFVIGRHTGRRNMSPAERAHCVVQCRDWTSAGRPASGQPSPASGAGAPETRPVGRVSARTATNQQLAEEADVSERTIRRAKARVRAQGQHNASAAVQPAAAPAGQEIQAPAVDAVPVAASDAPRVGSKPDDAQRGGIAAVVDGDAPALRGRVERQATEPAADQASGRSEPSTGIADAKIVMAPTAAPASSDGGSSSFNRAAGGRVVDRRSHRFRRGLARCARAGSCSRNRRANRWRRRCRAQEFDFRVDGFRVRGPGGRPGGGGLDGIERQRVGRRRGGGTGAGAGPATGRARQRRR